jgi:membrane protein DedA with SNARE-associated domain
VVAVPAAVPGGCHLAGGRPVIGTAALGAAAVAASQGGPDLAAVIAVAAIAGEAGGLGGYAIGRRWAASCSSVGSLSCLATRAPKLA